MTIAEAQKLKTPCPDCKGRGCLTAYVPWMKDFLGQPGTEANDCRIVRTECGRCGGWGKIPGGGA